MNKKLYTRPQTERIAVALVSSVAVTSLGVDNNSTNDMRDPAPLRQFSGDAQGLKYLI